MRFFFVGYIVLNLLYDIKCVSRRKPRGAGFNIFPVVLRSNGYIFKRSGSLYLPTSSLRVNSERDEFAPTGANSFL